MILEFWNWEIEKFVSRRSVSAIPKFPNSKTPKYFHLLELQSKHRPLTFHRLNRDISFVKHHDLFT